MVETGSPYRSHHYNHYNHPPDDNGDPRNAAMNFQQDYKEKRKLLIRWNHYFPHEHVKEFDVSPCTTFGD